MEQRGGVVVDAVRPPHVFSDYPWDRPMSSQFLDLPHDGLYGNGYTYARRVFDAHAPPLRPHASQGSDHQSDQEGKADNEDTSCARRSLKQRLMDHEFDLVIYGNVHRGMPFWSIPNPRSIDTPFHSTPSDL